MDPHGCLSEKVIDSVCVGEGEEAMLEAVEEGKSGGCPEHGLPGRGRTVIEPLRPFIDITRLPPKDYDIFDFQR